MKTQHILIATALSACLAIAKDAQPPAPVAEIAKVETATDTPLVQIAVLLDTSGSMNGLIEQAKTQLWKLVNEFITAKQDGKTPIVQVALYEYGKSSLRAEENWIRQIQPLTRDLDKVSEDLFALTTNGGDEYCGAVIQRATKDLAWDANPKVYKAIFIAGNEPFNQGPVDSKKSCQNAIAKGIIVNTIHCGGESQGIAEHWNQGALLADGKYLVIDQNQAIVHIEAPQDKEIVKLNEELNKTYVSYGKDAPMAKARQVAQDGNAAAKAESGAQVQRIISKASANYCNTGWDLVDACKEKDFDITKVKEADLPEEMRKMSVEERKAYLEKKIAERAEIQKQVLALNKDREAYVATQRKESAKTDTLDAAMTKALRSQAEKKGIAWEK
ncbi:MAG: VWA domain-containing protein [Prosthecobacter sp.]|uniref:vWA domain-containing protein n=1 Tax=Prosthecobacter sp. TaxID=1965333 RepID=UPI0025EC6832|nr:vWA domain-containing protein [Prosthecobacter sp.]MCF7785398.1 VWA domain-containing protein [Prosthecobacter sp.]